MSVRNFELFGGDYGSNYLRPFVPGLGNTSICRICAATCAGLPLSLGLIFVVLGYRTVLSQVLYGRSYCL